MGDTPFLGSAASVRRWAEDRRIANAVEVRELVTTWGAPDKSIAAAFELAFLYESLHGWPPAEDPIDRREDEAAWDRFARLRRASAR